MKKKFLSFVLTFAFILTGALFLTACGGETKHYYTTEDSEHCEIVFQGQTWDDAGFYVLDGEKIDFWVNIEEGYECADFKLTVGSTELTPTETHYYGDTNYVVQYTYSFTPNSDFAIKTTGNFTKISKQLTMSKDEWYDETNTNNSQLFIRFKQNTFGLPTVETVYSNFVKNRLSVNFVRNIPYGEGFSFDIYYKDADFVGDPSVADGPAENCVSTFYNENGEIGYHFTYTQRYSNSNVTFGNYTASRNIYILTSELSGMQDSLESDKLDITLPEEGSKIVTITIKDYANIDSEILSGLKLNINGKNQNIDFSESSTNGVFEITLKNPWQYSDSWSNLSYEINLNFYEFDYFNGIVELPPLPPIE